MAKTFNPSKLEIPVAGLRWRCDPITLGFDCTDELLPPEGFIGQDRAISALEFGLGMNNPGFNIFVTGFTGTGRTSMIKTHLERIVEERAEDFETTELCDWAYVYNFTHPEQPRAIELVKGTGREFVREIGSLTDILKKDLQAAFKSDSYKEEASAVAEALNEQRQKAFGEAEQTAKANSFNLQATSSGISIIAVKDGNPLDPAEISALDDDAKSDLEARRKIVAEAVEDAVRIVQRFETETSEKGRTLDRRIAERAVAGPFNSVSDRFKGNDEIAVFLDGLKDHTLQHLTPFFASGDGGSNGDSAHSGPTPTLLGQSADPFLPFQVNLFVDNSETSGPPVIVEENPTYANLFGQIERRPVLGIYQTDHMMLRAGSILMASGGYLVVRARDVLRHPGVWEGLKRVLRGGEVRTEDQGDFPMPALLPQGLRPEAIPVDLKVIMTGDSQIYHLLSAYDEEYWEMFKVRADFDYQMNNNIENVASYSSLICGLVSTHGIRHFDNEAVAAVVEHGARVVDDQKKLSTRFGQMSDLLVEADHWAGKTGAILVGVEHVEKAIEQKVYRSSLMADRMQEMLVDGTLLVDLEGEEVGQVNGLAVYSLGDISFGKPSRITASTYMGKPGVVNIEREVKLSGSTHDKGVLILSGYLGRTFAQEFPLAVAISIAFEQSYSGVDGDSASSTELYAILSSLSGVPIKQGIAVTGSVNQMGEVQPIGGANEKIEGFYDVCKAAGKLGPGVAVMIPAKNRDNLMLRPDIVKAAADGLFRIYAVNTIDEGISILTGVPAGEKQEDGSYPDGTVNGLVTERLSDMADKVKQFANDNND